MPATTSQSQSDIRRIALLTAGTSLGAYALLHVLSRVIAPFDSSHLLATSTPTSTSTSPPSSEPGLRWDALHFAAIALRGYTYEQQLAFQPGWQGVLHLLSRVVSRFGAEEGVLDGMLRMAFAVNLASRVVANVMLYKMTTLLFSRPMAVVASVLYAFPPAPAVLVAPYTESPFSALLFGAIYASLRGRYVLASALFAAGTSVRPTGVLGAAILVAHVVFAKRDGDDRREGNKDVWRTWLSRLPQAAILCVPITLPFVSFQAYSYYSFCVPAPARPWCASALPLSYSWVQREYWNVGPFRYWTPQQLPNFLLAAPVLYFSIRGCIAYVSAIPTRLSSLARPEWPIYAYQSTMLGILVFASHTQIALRLSLTDPVLWWTLARLVLEGSRAGRVWIWWCAIWGAVSLVLWAGHYPPA